MTLEFLQLHIVQAEMSLRVRGRRAVLAVHSVRRSGRGGRGVCLHGAGGGGGGGRGAAGVPPPAAPLGLPASRRREAHAAICLPMPHTGALRNPRSPALPCAPLQDIGAFHGYTISTLSRRAK